MSKVVHLIRPADRAFTMCDKRISTWDRYRGEARIIPAVSYPSDLTFLGRRGYEGCGECSDRWKVSYGKVEG